MSPIVQYSTLSCACCLIGMPSIALADAHDGVECTSTTPGLSVHVDNDLLSGAARDADYTAGMVVRWTPDPQIAKSEAHRLHLNVNRLLRLDDANACRNHVWQPGLLSFTPVMSREAASMYYDRPFASALVLGTSALWNDASDRTAMQSMLEFGALGLGLARSVHGAVHQLVGSEKPQGYRHQISDGGEFTARYAWTQYRLMHDDAAGGGTLQVKRIASLSAGYLTEGAVGWSMRWGRINTPWRTFAAEFADYLPAPAPLFESASGELYAFAGARIKLRGYNALAQGQFRDSDHVLRASELEHWLGEAWFGMHWRSAGNLSITYTVRVQTPELREEPARRTLVWAGPGVSWTTM